MVIVARSIFGLVTVAIISCASTARADEPSPLPLSRFVTQLDAALHAHDAAAAAALFTLDADATLIGDGAVHGRAAVARAAAALIARYPDARLTVGRSWIARDAAVVELLFAGTRAAGKIRGRPVAAARVGLAIAAVVDVDRDGRVRTLRLYADTATLLGQVAPQLLPAELHTRAVATRVPAGVAVNLARSTVAEAHNLALADATWAALDAHHADDVLASAAADYQYEDFSAPTALSKAETLQMVANFVTLVQDFKIADKPVHFAAGDDVVTEMVEHASFEGRPIVLHGLDLKHFRNGVVVREWQYANYVEVMTQLLKLPPPPLF